MEVLFKDINPTLIFMSEFPKRLICGENLKISSITVNHMASCNSRNLFLEVLNSNINIYVRISQDYLSVAAFTLSQPLRLLKKGCFAKFDFWCIYLQSPVIKYFCGNDSTFSKTRSQKTVFSAFVMPFRCRCRTHILFYKALQLS